MRVVACAAAALACPCAPSFAQSADLDPAAPLDPLPELGVEWPDMSAPDAPPIEDVEAPASEMPAPLSIVGSEERRYSVVVEGLEGVDDQPALVEAFDRQSELRADRDDEANAAQIDRRSRADAELLAELLRSRGYFDAVVEPRIEPAQDMLSVVLAAEPGRQYTFQSVELPGLEAAGAETEALRRAFAVKAGDPVIAENVIRAGTNLQVALGEEGFALAEIGEQQVEIDHQSLTASLILPVQPGPVARYGQIKVSGKPPFPPSHIATIARFDTGDPFKRSEINDLRRALIATGLVAVADVRLVPSADRQTVNVDVHLEPAPMRTVAGELGYGTGEGIRAEASWQHRNFVNPEGALTLRGVAGTQEQLVSAEFRRSNFMRRDQVLDLLALASNVDRDAYRAKTLQLSGLIERQSNIIWRKKWTWSYGADLIATDERGVFDDLANKETRTFLIAALPFSLRYDGSNDLLDPTTGFRLGGRVSPEISARGGSFQYGRLQIDASAYFPVSDSVVAAGRVRVGTIVGAKSSEIAPSRRFYSGGGGSVRGYGYQRLGPRDAFDDPIGGRGLAEFALEARVRLKAFGGNFGIVPFLDGGTLTTDVAPDVTGWQFGAGLGVRYYSSFGPIRVDVGTPLNPRANDARVAVVVSLGQAF
ncbi:MAG TPA: BamA/TamA family outer membrane protein [Sphingomicrobium sp.]|nr:BamA/TamA family outer membrane protein [Sphingomicrobium sp.]